MAQPSLRGHQGQFKVYKDGSLVDIVCVTNVKVSMDSSMTRSFYVGNTVGESDQTVEGWSGSFDQEVKSATLESFFDALINDNNNGIGVSDYTFTVTENYPDGTVSSYVYVDCVFKYSRSAAGLNEKITKSIEFQAAARLKVS